MVKVNHLGDGSAVENATVEVFIPPNPSLGKGEKKGGSRQPQPCARVSTDETGTAILSGEIWQQCLKDKSAPELLVIAKEAEDWAFVQTNEYSGAYSYGIYAGWDEGKPISRGTIFSDRKLYQPGEKAEFTGVAYYLQNGELKQDRNKSYQVTLKSPDGEEIDLGTQITNEFGTFSLELPLDQNQPLGFYSLQAKGESGAEIDGEFRVAEFKPPNFKVELNLDRKFAFVNQQVTATATSNYLFGSPVQDAKVNYFVTRRRTYFTPEGWDKFAFGRQWFWPEEQPEIPSDVLQTSQVLDATGKDSQQIAVAQDLPYPMTYRVESQVTDVSNLSVSNTQTFTALPDDLLIGLHSDFVGEAGKSVPVEVVVTDVKGNPIAGERIRVELQEMKYSQVTQLQEGSRTSRNQVEYKTVAQEFINSADEPQTVSLTPPESGSYRIRANFANSKDEVTATDTQIWVTGDSLVAWGDRYDNNRLEIKLDKDSYQPGETATALIQSPYSEAELYFAVVRHDTIYQTMEKVKGGAPEIQFTVTPDMVPNAAVEAVLVRQGELETGRRGDGETGGRDIPDNLVRIGFTPFKTDLTDKYLQVKVEPQQEQSEPGGQETIALKLENQQGNPVTGQFTVMVVNEAVLQLTGYRPPDLVETVYAEQEITTRFADNRPEVVLTPPSSPLEKGWGYGGGKSVGAANTRIREDFRPLAYYNGSVLTDTDGKANITFTLPDDLTTWRVMAVATDGDFHFGTGEATFVTTKPLVTNPVLPQFVRLGDRFLAGLSVTNTGRKEGRLTIKGSVAKNLQFEDQTSLRTDAESGTRAYRFPLLANKVGEGKVQFTTQLNGERDGFAVPLEVTDLQVTEQVVESGVTTSRATIPLEVDNQVVPDAGGLDVFLASTLIPQLTLPAIQVLQENQLPFLEPSASQLAIAANLQILSQQYQQALLRLRSAQVADFNLNQTAAQAVANLAKLQRDDGGFASWTGQKRSDPFLSPYAAISLSQAQDAGFPIDSGMVNRLQTYLAKILANPGQYEFCRTVSCKNQVRLEALIALAELGDKRTDYLGSIYEQREQLDSLSQIQLARYLSQFPNWQTEAQNLFNQLQETVSQRGRLAKVNLPQSWRWFHSPTAAQAETLRLFIVQKASPEVLNRLLQGLLDLRRELTWRNSFDNAQALSALVAYSQLQPTPPNYSATVKLGRRQLGKVRFQGYRKPSLTLNVPMSELPRGRHDLILQKSGSGNLHYLTAYRYRLQGNQPGRLQGLRVLRYVRPANQEEVLRKINLYATEEPLMLPAGQVFDIGLEIITDHPVDHLVINDSLPAGLEAVDTSFQTASSYYQSQGDSWKINYQKIYKDKVVAYGDSLAAGVYSLHYLVRSVTPGTFEWPGAEVYLQYAPEEFGRCASSTLEVKE